MLLSRLLLRPKHPHPQHKPNHTRQTPPLQTLSRPLPPPKIPRRHRPHAQIPAHHHPQLHQHSRPGQGHLPRPTLRRPAFNQRRLQVQTTQTGLHLLLVPHVTRSQVLHSHSLHLQLFGPVRRLLRGRLPLQAHLNRRTGRL